MTIVNIKQRTPEWQEWRENSITASMIPIIMGLNPHYSPYQLWAEQVGLKEADDLSKNPHVQRGIKQEPEARKASENRYGKIFFPVCVEHDANPQFKASLDGLDMDDGEVLEIKCICESTYEEIVENKNHSTNVKMYAAQVQWQLFCSGVNIGKLFFYLRGKPAISITIRRNDTFIEQAKVAALDFLDKVKTKTPPPLREGDVVYEEVNTEWSEKTKKYQHLHLLHKRQQEEIKKLKSQMNEIENEIISEIPDDAKSLQKGNILATKVERKGSIDYKAVFAAIKEQHGIHIDDTFLSQFQKESTHSYRFTVTQSREQTTEKNVESSQQEIEVVKPRTPDQYFGDQDVEQSTSEPITPEKPLEFITPKTPADFFKTKEDVYF